MPKNKQPSKILNFLRWFKPTTPAKGLLLFAVAFCLVGGGYMLRKSLAAQYSVFANQIYNGGNAYTSNVCDSSKKCAEVWVLVNTPGNVYTTFHLPAPDYDDFYYVCMYARLPENASGYATMAIQAYIGSNRIGIGTGNIVPSKNWQTVCVSTNDVAQNLNGYNVKLVASYNFSSQHTYDNVLLVSLSADIGHSGPF